MSFTVSKNNKDEHIIKFFHEEIGVLTFKDYKVITKILNLIKF